MQWMLLAFCVPYAMQHQRHRHSMQLSIVTEATLHHQTLYRHHNFENTFAIVISASPKGFLPHPAMQTFEQSLHYTLKIGLPACTSNTIIGPQMVSNWLQKSAKCPNVLQFHYFYPFHVGRCETWIVFFF